MARFCQSCQSLSFRKFDPNRIKSQKANHVLQLWEENLGLGFHKLRQFRYSFNRATLSISFQKVSIQPG